VASVTSNGVDSQLPPALNVQKCTPGRHHLTRLALSRAEVKASEPSVKAGMEKVKKKERKSSILGKLSKKSKHKLTSDVFFKPCITRFDPFQAPILRLKDDRMPVEANEKSSEQARCEILQQQTAVPLHLVIFRPFS